MKSLQKSKVGCACCTFLNLVPSLNRQTKHTPPSCQLDSHWRSNYMQLSHPDSTLLRHPTESPAQDGSWPWYLHVFSMWDSESASTTWSLWHVKLFLFNINYDAISCQKPSAPKSTLQGMVRAPRTGSSFLLERDNHLHPISHRLADQLQQ